MIREETDTRPVVIRDPSGEVDEKGNQLTVRVRRDVWEMIRHLAMRDVSIALQEKGYTEASLITMQYAKDHAGDLAR